MFKSITLEMSLKPFKQTDWEVVNDPENGCYLHKKDVSGTIYFCMPFPDKMSNCYS